MDLKLDSKSENNRLYGKSQGTVKAKEAIYSQDRNNAHSDCLSEEIPLIFRDPQVLEGTAGKLEGRMFRGHFGSVTICPSTRSGIHSD